MQLLTNLTDAADQLMTLTLDDGSTLQLELIYRPNIQRWSANITHPLLTLVGYNLAMSPNILRPWRNLIPFGIAIDSTIGLDPIAIEDWADGNSLIYILNASDVAFVETNILAPVPLVNP